MSKYSETSNEKNLYNTFSQIDIVVGGDHGQGKFRSVGKFIMRDKKGSNKDSYVIKMVILIAPMIHMRYFKKHWQLKSTMI